MGGWGLSIFLMAGSVFGRWRGLWWVVLFVGVTAAGPPGWAEEPSVLVVGVTPSPPFSYERANGEWTGLTVELWRRIADRLDLDYKLQPYTVRELLAALRTGEADVAAAALVVTAERERFMDFSHSFYSGGLSVATRPAVGSVGQAILQSLFTWPFLLAVGALLAGLMAVGFIIWLAERHRNPEHFGGSVAEGVGSGFWWSAVTMTTVGYGDKYPISRLGKAIGFIWMFSSLLLVSVFTGAVASSLTVSTITPRISSFQDLYGARVGTVAGSQAEAFLRSEGVAHVGFPDTEAGLRAVAAGRLDGFVNDAALLRHLVREAFPGRLVVLENDFQPGFYALGLSAGSPLLTEINLALLEITQSAEWPSLQRRFLGQ